MSKDRRHTFFGMTIGKTFLKRLVFDNNREGLNKLLMQTGEIKLQHGLKDAIFGPEPTSNYHTPLSKFLIKRGHSVGLVSSEVAKRVRELLDRHWEKHDSKEAANVADLISLDKP